MSEVRKVDSMFVVFGKNNLSSTDETNVIRSSVSEIFIHPDWEYTAVSYDADIAILKLGNLVFFNPNVKSIEFQTTCNDFVHIGYAVSVHFSYFPNVYRIT